jgi:hypothetical protein
MTVRRRTTRHTKSLRDKRAKKAATKSHNTKIALVIHGGGPKRRGGEKDARIERARRTVARQQRRRTSRKSIADAALKNLRSFGHDITRWLQLTPGKYRGLGSWK